MRKPRGGLAGITAELLRASRPLSAALAGLVVAGGILPLVLAAGVAGVVRAVPAAVHRQTWVGLGVPFAAVIGAFTLAQILDVAREGVSFVLAGRVEHDVRDAVVAAALSPPGIAHLHSRDFDVAASAAVGATPGGVRPATAVLAFGDVAVAKLSGAGALVLLARWHLWVPVVLGVAWAATIPWLQREGTTARSLRGRRSEALRRAAYFRDLALQPDAAKELRLFGLAPWLAGSYLRTAGEALAAVWSERRRHRGRMLGALVAVAAATAVVFGTMAVEAGSGRLSVANAALFSQLVLVTMAVGWTGDAEWLLREGASVVAAARSIAPAAPATPRRPDSTPSPVRPAAIAFADVGFAYPGEPDDTLRSVTFAVPAGACLALVGDNGAGKSTAVRLLAGLYPPDSGAVLIDGTPLAPERIDSWRSHLACIFQEFTRYHATLADNVALGVADPGSVTSEECAEALRRAGAADLLLLPQGLVTLLGEGYEGCTGLSGGQWQRVALARALLAVARGADTVVLDEPTASLDVRAEAAFFDRLFTETEGLTRLVVSHRLASVRRADLIVVLHEGRVAETGTHTELMAAGGRYAAMYRLQASAFGSASTGECEGPVRA